MYIPKQTSMISYKYHIYTVEVYTQDTILIQWSGCWIAVKNLQSATSISCSADRSLLQKPYLKAVQKTVLIVPRNSAVTKPPQAGIAYLILLTMSDSKQYLAG